MSTTTEKAKKAIKRVVPYVIGGAIIFAVSYTTHSVVYKRGYMDAVHDAERLADAAGVLDTMIDYQKSLIK